MEDRASGQLGAIMQATFVQNASGFTMAKLYKVHEHRETHEYVLVMYDNTYNRTKFHVMPSTSTGALITCNPLFVCDGDGIDHAEALRRAGYTVQE